VADARAEHPAPARELLPKHVDRATLVQALEQQMREAAAELDFELAAQLRDQLFELKAEADAARPAPRRPARSRRGA
jgi:excinuclease ABC subunit B